MYSMRKSYSYNEEKFKSTIKRSQTTSAIESSVVKNRGFKPTDLKDPSKKSFLEGLSKKIWTDRVNAPHDGKKVNLQKIFTPATDSDEILPGTNRKLFASSSFYSPTIHPTVEDQVELARRISHSLSDISNQQSKGQSMYSNRKKRSVKWIHDDGREEERFIEEHQETKENGFETSSHHQEHTKQPSGIAEIEPKKVPLKLVMDPRHVQDLNSMRQFGYEPSAMSPEYGYELVNALNSPTEKGAELFAKRRKKAEKWVIDGTQQHQQQQQQQKVAPPCGQVPAPWEVPFDNQQQIYSASTGQVQQYDYGSAPPQSSYSCKKEVQYQSTKQTTELTARDLAYRPSVPQGWNRPPVVLPAEFSEVVHDEALESEMTEIYKTQQNYLELIRRDTPTPPLIEYQSRCGQVETNVYEEPVKELIVEPDTKEATPEYETIPVRTLISTFEQGIYTPPEIPVGTTTSSSMSSEKYSKFSSTTTSSFNDLSLPPQTAPLMPQSYGSAPAPAPQTYAPAPQVYTPAPAPHTFTPAPAPAPAKKPVYQVPQSSPKPYQSSPQGFKPKPQSPAARPIPPTASPATIRSHMASPRVEVVSPRTGVNASAVTSGIFKKQIQLDAAVPVPPGGVVPSSSPLPSPGTGFIGTGRSVGKSPVPFVNTSPAPFGFPALSIQTPETIAEVAPAATPLVPPLQNPNVQPLPFIVSTPLPCYSSSYNNAARPFNEFKDYYRPINMDSVSHKLIPPVVYTDF